MTGLKSSPLKTSEVIEGREGVERLSPHCVEKMVFAMASQALQAVTEAVATEVFWLQAKCCTAESVKIRGG